MTEIAAGRLWVVALAIAATLTLSNSAHSEAQQQAWVEEPGAKSLDVEGGSGRAYLDTASVHRGDDGLVYFVESSNVARPEDIGKVGLMKDAYDCAKDLKYVCVGNSNWRNDLKSTVNAASEPALPVYRKYLCGD
ncbi:MAG: hypothetical protein Q7S58_03960 [Candidatus Binatus sp.]|uniref:hypothetical protein n=1 Tax=Candidatus Binatus sp. TaxID=2811406 RepID=UPI00272391E6|nr:hypothetical protein [Candidatus Binatus sp.]MDO8431546.1 hypothetical protein [Candidatus Binatus sp.]